MRNWNYINGAEIGNSTWYEPRRMPFQPRALRYAYEQAKKKGLSGQKLEAEMLRILKTTPHESAATESEMRKDVSEWVLHNGNPEDFVNNKSMETGNCKFINSDREFFKELADDAKKEEKKDDADIEKVKNAVYDMTDRDYENEYKRLVQQRNNTQEGTAEYEKIQKRLAEIRKKLGRSPFGNKIFNAKAGNMLLRVQAVEVGKPWVIYYDTEAEEFYTDYKGSIYDNPGFRTKEEAINYVKKRMKVGNSASDDKFAYVMREFDEGKLKTPDGKVVTDPAQAKAIAYSESKEAENGLARARNAIKK